MLRKFVIASLIAASAGAAALPAAAVDAAPGTQTADGKGEKGRHHRQFDPAKFAEWQAKRQAHMKELLHLTPAQEGAWQNYLAATKMTPPPPRDPNARKDHPHLSEPERMEKMLSHLKEMESKMSAHLAALKTFYAVLSPEQRTIFELSHHMMGGHHHGHHWMRGHHGGPGGHEGGPGQRRHFDGPDGPQGPGGPADGPEGFEGPGPDME